jgi:GR25 family glycosyltransferase involved in LPS biosynthesis
MKRAELDTENIGNIIQVKKYIEQKQYEKSHELILKLLEFPYDDDSFIFELLDLQRKCKIDDTRFSTYNFSLCIDMSKHIEQNRARGISSNSITVTMTTCKRYDLFQQTINSLLACCSDLSKYIHEFIVIDDNSCFQDRKIMQDTYPFITYIFKTPEQKGHAKSMNILLDKIVTPYVFHLEDDWRFFVPDNFITKCIAILEENPRYGQCLLNRGYGEDIDMGGIIGGGHRRYCTMSQKQDKKSVRYYIHEYSVNDALNKLQQTLGGYGLSHACYWPHYSLRVGLTKRDVFTKIGKYNETAEHFEREYAYRYRQYYLTVYLDNVFCTHIGRKTYERGNNDKTNAYDLNQECQFGNQPKLPPTDKAIIPPKREIQLDAISAKTNSLDVIVPSESQRLVLKCYVLNLARRQDRLKKFREINPELRNYHVFVAIDGQKLSPCHKIQKLFEKNDYNYRRGLVGCALSHLLIWVELIHNVSLEGMLVVEDDAELTKDFIAKFLHALSISRQADILFLGHHPYPDYIQQNDQRRDIFPTTEQWSKEKSIRQSMGGTTAYYITKLGAINMIKWITEHGFRYGVDWEMFHNTANKVYYCSPFLAFADCAQSGSGKPVDTDIQYVYDGVGYKNEQEWIREELKYWTNSIDKNKNNNSHYTMLSGIKEIKQDERPEIHLQTERCSKKELLSSISLFLLDEPLTSTKNWLNTFPVHYYTVNKHFIVIPDNMLTDIHMKERVFDGHMNIQKVLDD